MLIDSAVAAERTLKKMRYVGRNTSVLTMRMRRLSRLMAAPAAKVNTADTPSSCRRKISIIGLG
jgi:hypothetical protein